MPERKNTPFNVTLLMFLLAMTLFNANPQMQGGFLFSDIKNRLLCHFYHANIFHFLANALVIYLMRPSPCMILKAYPIAVIAVCFSSTPVIGISALLYSYIGMNIIKWNVSLLDWGMFILSNVFTLFIPGIAFGVHMTAFVLGLITYKLSLKTSDR